jgi:hypothetical protein
MPPLDEWEEFPFDGRCDPAPFDRQSRSKRREVAREA